MRTVVTFMGDVIEDVEPYESMFLSQLMAPRTRIPWAMNKEITTEPLGNRYYHGTFVGGVMGGARGMFHASELMVEVRDD
jgi:hypothetical protein